MKKILTSLGISLLVALAVFSSKPIDAQPRVGININFQTFYDELSPYGDWIDYPDYGYTWRPRIGRDFRPYSTGGHWAYADDYDWMWASDYDWGWAPFHYGRWFYDQFYGWLWVPGYDWSPAWVAWRGGGDYYGWAPLRPGFNVGYGFDNYDVPYDYWTFAPGRYMNSRYISRYYYPYSNNVTIINNTTIINNYGRGYRGGNYGRNDGYVVRDRGYYSNGPRRADVERYTGRIQSVNVRDVNRPGRTSVSSNQMSIYRPTVSRTRDNTGYAPRNVRAYEGSRSDAARVRGTNDVYSGGRTRENVNVAQGRGNIQNGEANGVSRGSMRNNGDMQQRQAEMRQRQQNDQMQMQREQQMEQRRSETRQRQNDQMMQQRQSEMRQRQNEQMQMQRQQQMEQRQAEMRQRQNDQMMQQRQSEMRQRQNEQMQMQRQQQMEQRQAESRQRQSEMMQQRQQERVSVDRGASSNNGGSVDRTSRGGERRRF